MTFLESGYERIEQGLLNAFSADNWKVKLVLVGVLVMLLSFFNNLSPLKSFADYYDVVFKQKKEFFLYQTVEDRAGNLTGNFDYEPYSGKESRAFRYTVPLFVKLFHIEHVSIIMYGVQLLVGILFLYMLVGFLHSLTEDKVSTIFSFLGIMSLYVGASFFIDNASYGDLFSFFFLFLSVRFYKNPILLFIFLQLAFWNDERAFVASGLVLMWAWWYPQFTSEEKVKFKITLPMLVVVAAWGVFWGIRLYLQNEVGIIPAYNPEGEFGKRIVQSFWSLGFRLLWQFEAWWLLFILAAAILWKRKAYLSLIGIYTAGLVSMLSAMIIYDSTRSGSFAYLLIFFGLLIIKKELTIKQQRILLLIVAILCFLHPMANKTHGVGFFLM